MKKHAKPMAVLDIDCAQKMASEVSAAYATSNSLCGREEWKPTDYAAGLSGDVGDLIKIVMALDGKRFAAVDLREKLEHELSDCLWSILTIAEKFDVDLAEVFPVEMSRLLARVTAEVTAQGG